MGCAMHPIEPVYTPIYRESLFVHVMPGSLGFPDSQTTLGIAEFCGSLGPASVALLRNEIAFQMLFVLVPPSAT